MPTRWSRALVCVVRALAGPFGLFRVRAETAAYNRDLGAAHRSPSAYQASLFANVALLLGLHRAGLRALLRLVMLIVHLFIVVIILQCAGRSPRPFARRPAARAQRPGCAIASPAYGTFLRSLWTSHCGLCGR